MIFKKLFFLFWVVTACVNAVFVRGESVDFDRLYLGARFFEIIQYFETKEKQKDYRGFPLEEKLLYIECLARTAKARRAEAKLKPLLTANPSDPAVLSIVGVVYLSLGNLDRAGKYIDETLQLEPGNKKALLSKALLLLYHRKFAEAKQWYEKSLIPGVTNRWVESDLVFLVGFDVYRACRDSRQLTDLFKAHAGRIKKVSKRRYRSLKANYHMYKSAGNKMLFHTETGSDKVTVPFATGEKVLRVNTIAMTVNGKTYKVLLDTGNGTGWILHSSELKEQLKPKKGGHILTRIGTEAGLLDGYRHYYKVVDFNAFKIHHPDGVYVPKPHPHFPDANLNPMYIDNRVVTLNFAGKELVLRTKARFETDLAASTGSGKRFYRLPWYGYKYPFISVVVDEKQAQGLAMVETGAEDIAFRFDFADALQLPLKVREKYLANGKVFRYHQAQITLVVGGFRFPRKAAEVWPFKGFHNRLSGLSPDVIMGPTAFIGKYSVSFDPFDNQIILLNL